MLVLDTDLVSIVQRERGETFERLRRRLEAAAIIQPVCVTIVSFEEQTRGWLSYIANARTLDLQVGAYSRLQSMLQDYCARQVLDFDDEAAQRFADLRSQKIRIGTMDLKIAAIALTRNAKLLSRNLTDFRKVPGLDVEDWTQP